MDLVKLLQDLATTIASLQLQLTDAQAALTVATDKAFADGATSRQVEVDEKVAVIAAKDVEIDGLKAEIEELKKNPDLQVQLDEAKAQIAALQEKIAKAIADLG